jgi:hypothetical protein
VEIIGSTYLQSVESNLGVSVQTFEDELDHLIEENILRNFVVCEVEEYAIVPVLVCNPEAILIV